MKPIIGMLAQIDDERTSKIVNAYTNAIESSGGIPILLPYVKNEETIESFVNMCDGFLFSGGVDIAPARYGEETKPTCGQIQLYRDELEFKIFDKIIKTHKPILAICRGIQIINVALGGTLYQDIPTEIDTQLLHKRQSDDSPVPMHSVKIIEGTPLFDLIGNVTMNANSYHHQAIKDLGHGLKVMALAEDGIIEAAYLDSERYIRAYQWHPEKIYDTSADNRLIFDDFIKACRV